MVNKSTEGSLECAASCETTSGCPMGVPHTRGMECKVFSNGLGNQVGVGLTRSTINPCSLLISQVREQVNNVRMAVSPLWCRPGNTHAFTLDGKSYP